jgi:glutathione S-transferase
VDSTNTPVDGTGDADLAALRCQVARIDATISNWKREQATLIDRAVESRVSAELEAAVKRQFALIEQREEAVKRREEQLDAAWKRLEQRLAKVYVLCVRSSLLT